MCKVCEAIYKPWGIGAEVRTYADGTAFLHYFQMMLKIAKYQDGKHTSTFASNTVEYKRNQVTIDPNYDQSSHDKRLHLVPPDVVKDGKHSEYSGHLIAAFTSPDYKAAGAPEHQDGWLCHGDSKIVMPVCVTCDLAGKIDDLQNPDLWASIKKKGGVYVPQGYFHSEPLLSSDLRIYDPAFRQNFKEYAVRIR